MKVRLGEMERGREEVFFVREMEGERGREGERKREREREEDSKCS